jgi:hypothetical protein
MNFRRLNLVEASDTRLIELPSYCASGKLSGEDRDRLIREVLAAFERQAE